jgi:hypothetical protein
MPLFVQIDLAGAARATGAALSEGLLELFYCVHIGDDCSAEGWAPFAPGKLVRIVPGDVAGGLRSPPPNVPHFPAKRIVGWEPVDDHPSPEEYADLGLAVNWDGERRRLTLAWKERGISIETDDIDLPERLGATLSGDKLLGWPAWVQGQEYPSCPRCGKRMVLLFQIDSEDHVPYMFGDIGCGHVTRCLDHPDVVAFGWACS